MEEIKPPQVKQVNLTESGYKEKKPLKKGRILGIIILVLLSIFGGFYYIGWQAEKKEQKQAQQREQQKQQEEQKTKEYIDSLKQQGVFEKTTYTYKQGKKTVEKPYIKITAEGVEPTVSKTKTGELIIFRNEDYKEHSIQFEGEASQYIIKPAENYTTSFFNAGTKKYLIDNKFNGEIIIKL